MDCIPSSRFPHFIVGFWWMSWDINLTWNISHNIFDNIAFILTYSSLFCNFIWLPLSFSAWSLMIPFNARSHMLPEKIFADLTISMLCGILAKAWILGQFHPQPSSLGKHSFIRLMRIPRAFEDWQTCYLGGGSLTQHSNDKYSFRQFLIIFKDIVLSVVSSSHINFCSECVCMTQSNTKQLPTCSDPHILIPSAIPIHIDMHRKSLSLCCTASLTK